MCGNIYSGHTIVAGMNTFGDIWATTSGRLLAKTGKVIAPDYFETLRLNPTQGDQTMSRTAIIHVNPDDRESILTEIGRDAYNGALGYLSDWGIGLSIYAHVTIYIVLGDGLPEMHAAYRAEPTDPPGFTLHAIWNVPEKRWGFHS